MEKYGNTTAICFVLLPPFTLFVALILPSFSYRSYATRFLTTAFIGFAAVYVVVTVKITNPPLAFMTGLLEGWIVIWAAVLVIRYDPTKEARRRHWSKWSHRSGECNDEHVMWEEYPRGNIASRIGWSIDLLISFRGVGWRFETIDDRKDRAFNRVVEAKHTKRVGFTSGVFALVRDILVFQIVLTAASIFENYVSDSILSLRAVHTATWLATSVPFINFCHSAWVIIGEVGQQLWPSISFQAELYNPSPWGSIDAIIEHGLAGLWGVTWHSYFKFGFQSATDILFPQNANPTFRQITRVARVLSPFLMSGAIHYCGSYMLPGPTYPSREFVFFLLQGLVVILQILVYDRMIDRRYRRILNPFLIALWLLWTEPLIFGDQKAGGMWNSISARQ